jgi:hypothetical protein
LQLLGHNAVREEEFVNMYAYQYIFRAAGTASQILPVRLDESNEEQTRMDASPYKPANNASQ